MEVRLQDLTTSTYLGSAFLNGQVFSRTLTLSPGRHQLSAQAFDAAGNGSLASTYFVFVDQAPPVINNMAPVVPNPPDDPAQHRERGPEQDGQDLRLHRPEPDPHHDSGTSRSRLTQCDGVARQRYTTRRPTGFPGLAQFTTASGTYVLTVSA